METKRQKLIKQNTKRILSESFKTNEYQGKAPNRFKLPMKKKTTRPSSSGVEVTLLGSPSYHEQNRDLRLQSDSMEKSVQITSEVSIETRIEKANVLDNTNVYENKENSAKEVQVTNNQIQNVQNKTRESKEFMDTDLEIKQEYDNDDNFEIFEINIEIEAETSCDNGDISENMDTVELEKQSQEQIVDKQNNITDKKFNNHLQSKVDTEEYRQAKRYETEVNERLTPSISEEISETELTELRKSLEDGNSNEINIPPLHEPVEMLNAKVANDIELPSKDAEGVALEKYNNIAFSANVSDVAANDATPSEKGNAVAILDMNDNTAPPDNCDDAAVLENDDDAALSENGNDEATDQVKISAKQRRKRRKVTLKKSYVDFLSEEEDFIWDSSSWKETDDESTASELESRSIIKKKKKKRSQEGVVGDEGLKKKKSNKRKLNKELKNSGKEYKIKGDLMIRAKELHENPCIGKKCGNNCGNITEEKRKNLFDHYWSLSPERKKDWLISMSSKKEINRKRKKDSTYRTNTFQYFINDGEGRRQVCKQFIMKTLDISQRYIYYTLSNAIMGIAKKDERGKTIPVNKTSDAVKLSAVNFIKKLPALPSHYSRKDSTRMYLPVEIKNIKNLYRIYKEEQVSKGIDVVSERIFREIFTKDFNLGFHIPKKDKCIKCLRFEGQDLSTNIEMRNHLEEKEVSRKRMECHREITKKNPSILCVSFDLQKVLNTPYGNSMLLFYSRKYTVYNLCFYESVTRNGYCYVWGETEGKRGGNEIATILHKYIANCDQQATVKSLILYSDSCPGQNKNKLVLAALHNALLVSKNLETIQINYLLPGHTEMTVDSIHSTIENCVRNTTVWAPSQWLTICQVARRVPKPYFAEALTHDDFKNYEEFAEKYFKGNLAGKISKIRVATFKKSSPNVMMVKYSMKEDAQEESIPILARPKPLNAKYKSCLPITKSKYNDLKKLCDTGAIPKIYHAEFLNLSHSNGKDVLIDTDIEDENEERE